MLFDSIVGINTASRCSVYSRAAVINIPALMCSVYLRKAFNRINTVNEI